MAVRNFEMNLDDGLLHKDGIKTEKDFYKSENT
jgi:hypothetical protein